MSLDNMVFFINYLKGNSPYVTLYGRRYKMNKLLK
jgi:hypothetical protein